MSNKKNLLIYAHYYIPDTASTGQILRELAEGMLDKFNITVICVVPSYLGTIEDKYKTQKYYEEEINGVKVLRIRVPEFSKTNKKSRVKNIILKGTVLGDGCVVGAGAVVAGKFEDNYVIAGNPARVIKRL